MKFRSIRGPNWVDARVKVTRMIEKTTPTTVMTAAAIAVRIWRAASALPLITHEGTANPPRYAARSSTSVHPNSAAAPSTSRLGTTHRLVRRTSRRQCEPSAEDHIARMKSPYRTAAENQLPTRLPGSPVVHYPTRAAYTPPRAGPSPPLRRRGSPGYQAGLVRS